MHHFVKRIFVAAAPLLLTGCLWGPGKFTSDLTLKKDGSFVLAYRGEVVLHMPPDMDGKSEPWKDEMIRCYKSGKIDVGSETFSTSDESEDPVRPCTATEIAKAKSDYEKDAAEKAVKKRKENEEMAKASDFPASTTSPTAPSQRSSANMPAGDRSNIAETACSTSITIWKAARRRTSSSPRCPTMIS